MAQWLGSRLRGSNLEMVLAQDLSSVARWLGSVSAHQNIYPINGSFFFFFFFFFEFFFNFFFLSLLVNASFLFLALFFFLLFLFLFRILQTK
jgi:hypothetical protein